MAHQSLLCFHRSEQQHHFLKHYPHYFLLLFRFRRIVSLNSKRISALTHNLKSKSQCNDLAYCPFNKFLHIHFTPNLLLFTVNYSNNLSYITVSVIHIFHIIFFIIGHFNKTIKSIILILRFIKLV